MVDARQLRSEEKDAEVSGSLGLPVEAIVLTFRRPADATRTVRELLDREGVPADQVLLVVNGDGGLDDPGLESRIAVLRLSENLGPAGGFARALEHLRDASTAPWVYLCEDDQGRHALPVPRLRALVGDVERYEEEVPGAPVGAVLASGRDISMRTGRTYSHGFRSPDARFEEVAYGPFWGALVSRRALEARVLPDQALFWGSEDLDFWLRLRRAGFRILVDAVAHRTARNKGSSDEPWCAYYMARNGFHLRRRHGGAWWTMWHLLKSGRRFQLATTRAHRVAIVRGLVDGLRGRTGRHPRFSR